MQSATPFLDLHFRGIHAYEVSHTTDPRQELGSENEQSTHPCSCCGFQAPKSKDTTPSLQPSLLPTIRADAVYWRRTGCGWRCVWQGHRWQGEERPSVINKRGAAAKGKIAWDCSQALSSFPLVLTSALNVRNSSSCASVLSLPSEMQVTSGQGNLFHSVNTHST